MIYILEGTRGSYKTSYANSKTDYIIKKLNLKTLEDIKNELESHKDENIVYDRLFLNRFVMDLSKNIYELEEINEYLKSLPYIKCIKFIGTKENHINKWKENRAWSDEKQKMVEDEYHNYVLAFKILDIFKSE